MTTTPLHRPTPTDPDDIMSDILRVLRDSDGPVLLRDLDATSGDRRAVGAALARLARGGIVDISAGHVSISPAHLRREVEPTEQPPTPAPMPQTPKPAPSTRDVLGLITTTLTTHGPMTTTQLTAHLPTVTHPRIPEALTLGTATGQLGRRNDRLFAPDPTHRTRRRSVRQRGSA